MKVRFLTIAEQEVNDAYRWFEERTEGSGLEFLDELDRVVGLVKSFRLAGLEIETQIRRTVFARFPYAIVYGVENDTVIVIAVAHTHREPRYWMDRA